MQDMMHCHNPSLLERQRAHLHWLQQQQQQQQQQQISTENLLCEGWPNDLTTPSPTTTTTTITTSSSAQAGKAKCSKKRKADKSPMVGSDADDEKRMKGDQWEKQRGINGREDSGNNNSSRENIEKKKHDFIHVRARRGQATDSHSLAERVRRERISERMKYLQGLVPGCDKITGKAGMLDEIINYVQSLQRQIEFLSMKLAAVNPRLDLNMESLLYTKEMNLPCNNSNISTAGTSSSPPEVVDPTFLQFQSLQQAVASCGFDMDTAMNPVEVALWRSISAPVSTPAATTEPFLDSFINVQRTNAGWDSDLHNLYGSAFPFNSLQGNILSNMKTEM